MNGIILAGGKATRLNGIPKGLIQLNGMPILENQVNLLKKFCHQIIIVSNDSSYHYLQSDTIVVISDLIKDIGPLGGLYTGLSFTNKEKNIVLACDMPYVSEDVMHFLISYQEKGEVIVPKLQEDIHPLCGIYSINILPIIQQQIEKNNFKLKHLLKLTNTFYVDFPDSMKNFLTNINTFEELNKWKKHGQHFN